MKKIGALGFCVLPLFLGCLDGPLEVGQKFGSQGGSGGSSAQGTVPASTGGDPGANGGAVAVTGGTSGTGGASAARGGAAGSVDPGATGGASAHTGAGGGTIGVVPFAPGAIVYLPFDEGRGVKTMDQSGHGNNGFVMQGSIDPSPLDPAPKWSTGRTGKDSDRAIELNGVDEWVRIPSSESINLTGANNAVSMSLWIYVNAITIVKPYGVIAQRHIFGTRGEHFMLGLLNGAPYAGQNHMGTTGPEDMRLAQWVHIALTFDGLSLSLYVNGEDVAHLDTGVPIEFDETPLSIGSGINETDVIERVNGRFDEFQLYARALTPAEVARLAGR